jgi:hypothetical protein
MKIWYKILFFIGLMVTGPLAFGQVDSVFSQFVGTVDLQNFISGGTGDVVGDLNNFSDQSNRYFASDIAVGDIVWDNQRNRWRVDAVNSFNLISANVDLTQLNASGDTPFGRGFVTRESETGGFSALPPDNSTGISPQLNAAVNSHNWFKIDAYLRDSVLSSNSVILTNLRHRDSTVQIYLIGAQNTDDIISVFINNFHANNPQIRNYEVIAINNNPDSILTVTIPDLSDSSYVFNQVKIKVLYVNNTNGAPDGLELVVENDSLFYGPEGRVLTDTLTVGQYCAFQGYVYGSGPDRMIWQEKPFSASFGGGYGLDVSGTRLQVDTTSEDGLVSKSRLSNALDDVGSGGSGNASGRALQAITADGTDTLDFGGTSYSVDYWQIDLSNVTSSTLNFTNPNTSIVPTYNLHFTNVSTDTITFASTFLDANLDTLSSHVFSQGQIVPMYYYNSNYYTNYLTLGSTQTDTTSEDSPDYIAEYQNIIDYANNNSYDLPNVATQTLQNTVIDSLKTVGVWDSIELLYVFAQNTALSDFPGINWKDTATHELVSVNGATFNADGAYRANDTSYFNTEYDFLNDRVVIGTSGMSFAYMLDTFPSDTSNIFGVSNNDTGDIFCFSFYREDVGVIINSPMSGNTTSDNDKIPLSENPANKVIHATSVNGDKVSYLNGVQIGTEESESLKNTFTSDDIYVLTLNFRGVMSPSGLSTAVKMKFLMIGRQMSEAKIQAFSNIMNYYFDNL